MNHTKLYYKLSTTSVHLTVMISDKLDPLAIRSGGGGWKHMTKMTLGLQNHWRMANGRVGIVPRDLALAEIRSNPLLGRRRGLHYNWGRGGGSFIDR